MPVATPLKGKPTPAAGMHITLLLVIIAQYSTQYGVSTRMAMSKSLHITDLGPSTWDLVGAQGRGVPW